MKFSILNSVIVCTAGLILFFSCQREHSNIFDPKNGTQTLDLNLRIAESDSIVVLQWNPPYTVHYQGFNIFRKIKEEEDFTLFDSVAADSLSWTDRQIQSGVSYSYYLTLQGSGIQSPPTTIIKTTPGPDRFWILDRWNFYILHLTSDLQHTIARHYAIDRPQNMCFNTSGNAAIITYTRQHYFEIFNPHNGEHLKDFSHLERPYDCLFDAQKNRFWISDSSGGIFTVDNETLELRSVNANLNRPAQLGLDAGGRIYVLDANLQQILRLNPDGSISDTLQGLGNDVTYFNVDSKNNFLYTISGDDSLKYLRRYAITDSGSTILFSSPYLQQVRHSPLDKSLWITLNNDNSAEILQLSAEGARLKVLDGLNYISDMNISPVTGTIIAGTLNLDTREGIVLHLNPDGSVIGSSHKVYYPYRVYIQ